MEERDSNNGMHLATASPEPTSVAVDTCVVTNSPKAPAEPLSSAPALQSNSPSNDVQKTTSVESQIGKPVNGTIDTLPSSAVVPTHRTDTNNVSTILQDGMHRSNTTVDDMNTSGQQTQPNKAALIQQYASSHTLPKGSVPAWAIYAPQSTSNGSYQSPYQQRMLLPHPPVTETAATPLSAISQQTLSPNLNRLTQALAIQPLKSYTSPYKNEASPLPMATAEEPKPAIAQAHVASKVIETPRAPILTQVDHSSGASRPAKQNNTSPQPTTFARDERLQTLGGMDSREIQQGNSSSLHSENDNPTGSNLEAQSASATSAQFSSTPANEVQEGITEHMGNQPGGGKRRRRTAAEIEELHAQRDRAGLPRLKNYPKDRGIAEDQDDPPIDTTPVRSAHSGGNIDEETDEVRKQKASAKRGRPKKVLDEQSSGTIIDKLPAKRGRPKKQLPEDFADSQNNGSPARKKRKYTKKAKPEQTVQPNMPDASQTNLWNKASEMVSHQDEVSSHHSVNMVQDPIDQQQYSSHPASNHQSDLLPIGVAGMPTHDLYPELPSMHTPAQLIANPLHEASNQSLDAHQKDRQFSQSNDPGAHGSHGNFELELRFNEFGEEGEYPSDDAEDDESDEDEEEDEDSAVYSNIMSQVNMITGTAPMSKGRGLAKQGLEDFLNFEEAEVEEEDVSDDDDAEIPASEMQQKAEKPKIKKRVRRRGPRVAAEPTGDIKMRLGLANEAFAESNMSEARRLVDEIIRINAETYEAWNLLSSICQEQEDSEGALMALIVAAHLRPKHVGAWFNAVDYALTSMGPVTPRLLREAEFCLSSCIRQLPYSVEARIRKSQVLVQRGAFNRAATDYRQVLKIAPHDLQLIRELGDVYVDLGDGVAGIDLYHKTLEDIREQPEVYDSSIDWNHAHSFAQLWTFVDKKSSQALKEVKALSRYLLGREHETYWDDVTDNDCEWDFEDTRRMSIVQYSPGQSPLSAYGEGLPIELRVPLGKFRLDLGQHDEASQHFNHLLGTNPLTGEEYKATHTDLLLTVGGFYEKINKFSEALQFYQAVKQLPYENTAELCMAIGKCFLRDDRTKEAEEAYREACLLDVTNINARVELARLYERLDEAEQAFDYVSQILELEKHKRIKLYGSHNLPALPSQQKKPAPRTPAVKTPVVKKPRKVSASVQGREAVAEALRQSYRILKEKLAEMRDGKAGATDYWMDAAKALTDDFRSCKAFYPWDRKEFDGYTAQDRHRAEQNLKLDFKVLSQMHGQNIENNTTTAADGASNDVPNHYRGVSFEDWVEIFSEYALCLARRGRGREAYDVCEAATHAICFCLDKQAMFSLHLTYCLCALLTNDEETCVAMARWFMTQFQFSTDSYRMFAALMRLCHSPISWYCSGPTQKFILRQIKTMDYALANEARRKVIHKDKAAYSHMDEHNQPIVNKELDVSLLMVYGHILIAGASYLYALNYFHRALAVDPENPVIALSLGLSYIQHALKRQIDNRQYAITQGVTYMNKYYIIRSQSPHFEERQEAHYNLARAYHLVGLTSLALPLYKNVLQAEGRRRKELSGYSFDRRGISDFVDPDQEKRAAMEDMCLDTAYNLQIIYTVAGNYELARKITRKWLTI